MSKLTVISWNLNGRTRISEQVAALEERHPDVVALQEVTKRTATSLADALAAAGFPHAVDSFALAQPDFIPEGPRRYGLLIASRFPLEPITPGQFDLPWPERVLSVRVQTDAGQVEIHATHIPPGSSNGWIKIDMLRGLFLGLAQPAECPRLLCGDFNTPQAERPGPVVITWAQRIRPDGTIRMCRMIRGKAGEVWDTAERNVLLGLADYDLPDMFRALHGYEAEAFSWLSRRRSRTVPRRFDHIFASASLHPGTCEYIHSVRERGLSDHSAIEAVFDADRSADS